MQSTQLIARNAIASAGLLPFSGSDDPTNPPSSAPRPGKSPQGDLADISIIVVEDDAANARLLAVVLKSEGAEVRIVRDAQEALHASSESLPRLMVLDLILPRMSGLMLAKQLKASPLTKDIVLIAVSGITGPETERMALASGCAAYLAKPIDIDLFLATVRTHAGGSDGLQ